MHLQQLQKSNTRKRTGKNQIIDGCTERCKGSRREDNGLRSRIWKTERHSSKDSWKETDTDRKCNEHQQQFDSGAERTPGKTGNQLFDSGRDRRTGRR